MNNPCMYIKFYITTGGINRFSETEKPAPYWEAGFSVINNTYLLFFFSCVLTCCCWRI